MSWKWLSPGWNWRSLEQAETTGAGIRRKGRHPSTRQILAESAGLDGEIELSVDCHGADRDKVLETLKDTGSKRFRSR